MPQFCVIFKTVEKKIKKSFRILITANENPEYPFKSKYWKKIFSKWRKRVVGCKNIKRVSDCGVVLIAKRPNENDNQLISTWFDHLLKQRVWNNCVSIFLTNFLSRLAVAKANEIWPGYVNFNNTCLSLILVWNIR